MLIYYITIGFILLFTLFFFIEPRTTILGSLFLLTTLISIFAIATIVIDTSIPFIYYVVALIAAILLFPLPIYLVMFCVIVLRSNYTLIKNEGFHVKNLLSILFVISIVLSIFVFPPIRAITTNIYIAIGLDLILLTSYYGIGLFVIYYISSKINEHTLFRKVDVIIVLGSGLIHNQVPPLLAQRIKKGVHYYHKMALKPLIIFSGGKGPDEAISEAQAMADYARTLDVQDEHIILEDQSFNTYQNLMYSKRLIKKDDHVLIVTSNFHLFRVLLLSRKLKIKAKGRGSRTKFYFWMNAFVREFIAYLRHTLFIQVVVFLLFFVGVVLVDILTFTQILTK